MRSLRKTIVMSSYASISNSTFFKASMYSEIYVFFKQEWQQKVYKKLQNSRNLGTGNGISSL
jgi:hypothetical protein